MMPDFSANLTGASRRGNDLLGPSEVESVDGLRSDERAVTAHDIPSNAAAGTATGGDRGPIDGELGTRQNADSAMDSSGHDPLDVEAIGVLRGRDDDSSGVFDLERIDAVDRVGAGDAVSGAVGGQIAGKRTHVEHDSKGNESNNGENDISGGHSVQSTTAVQTDQIDTFVFPRWMKGCPTSRWFSSRLA